MWLCSHSGMCGEFISALLWRFHFLGLSIKFRIGLSLATTKVAILGERAALGFPLLFPIEFTTFSWKSPGCLLPHRPSNHRHGWNRICLPAKLLVLQPAQHWRNYNADQSDWGKEDLSQARRPQTPLVLTQSSSSFSKTKLSNLLSMIG